MTICTNIQSTALALLIDLFVQIKLQKQLQLKSPFWTSQCKSVYFHTAYSIGSTEVQFERRFLALLHFSCSSYFFCWWISTWLRSTLCFGLSEFLSGISCFTKSGLYSDVL
ncbi:hypothetical protein L228DRAFT_17216 [Xylona heveae TC161]|uniref:Uncharacterized protein n=1 Tax=Xylona heveae (strain CBS 132557 / TC161) TaxID=1328760 RepID=A0A165JWN1_XYLHT|nr:hypothetical protein L228DRAFT_17216 [Xylona heveae TC161]KZF26716.1 hypothetical protein L228DRAFT_17216 [Xylona heveae TC161]